MLKGLYNKLVSKNYIRNILANINFDEAAN